MPGYLNQMVMEELSNKFDVVLSNVPGPRKGIVSCGKKFYRAWPYMVPAGNFGVGCNVYSMNGVMKFSLTTDSKCCKDP